MAAVDEIDIRAPQLHSNDTQEIEVWATGVFTNPCSKIGDIVEQRDSSTITLTMLVEQANRPNCETDEFVEFIQIVPIEIEGLHPGEYTVVVNGISGNFTIAVDDAPVQVDLTELFSNPELYNGRRIYTRGAYASGFETSALAQTTRQLGDATYLTEPAIWVNSDAVLSMWDCFKVGLTPPAEFCDAEVQGRFEYGRQYGHLGQYSYQISAED